MESIITVATVLTMYFNAISSTDSNYMYNADMEDGRVNSIEVYEKTPNQSLTQKMEYRYAYDEQGRLKTKEVLRWDTTRQTWTENTRLSYKYYSNGYNVEISKWNAAKAAYEIPSEVTLYREVAPSLTSVRTFRMNETQDNMYLADRMIVMETVDSRLLAGQ